MTRRHDIRLALLMLLATAACTTKPYSARAAAAPAPVLAAQTVAPASVEETRLLV